MWSIKNISEDFFKTYYRSVDRVREKTTISVLFETTRLLDEYNTDKGVFENDVVSVIRKGEIWFGIVKKVENVVLPYVSVDIKEAFYNSLNTQRAEHEKAPFSIEEKDVQVEYNEKFFEQIKSKYIDNKIFFIKNIYLIKYDYQTKENILEKREFRDKTPYYTRLKIQPGDLVIDYGYVGVVTYVAEPKNRDFIDDFTSKEMLFFRGDGDINGTKVLEKYIAKRKALAKKICSDTLLRSENNIALINENEAVAYLYNGKSVAFKVCRSLDDMLEKIAIYKSELLPLLTDKRGCYRDSHFASEDIINELKANYPANITFDGTFEGLLKKLIYFVRLFGYNKETMYDITLNEFKDKIGYKKYKDRQFGATHFEGVNLPKNFTNNDSLIFDVAPFYIKTDKKAYWFSEKKAYGLTIYNRANNPRKLRYYHEGDYNAEYYNYYKGGNWDLESSVVESYAILCLSDCPPVFTERFYKENIIFELDGKFYAYYVFREFGSSNFLNSNEVYNNPIAYYLSEDNDSLYGSAHKISNDDFDGAFAKDCVDLDDDQCTAIYYSTEGDTECIPEINEHFFKDKTGIYSIDGKVLYMAFNKNTRKYIVRDGVEEIRSYAFAYLERVDTIIIPSSIKKIGRLIEPQSKTKPILCPKLKFIMIPKSLYYNGIIGDCFCGVNIDKKRLNEIVFQTIE